MFKKHFSYAKDKATTIEKDYKKKYIFMWGEITYLNDSVLTLN